MGVIGVVTGTSVVLLTLLIFLLSMWKLEMEVVDFGCMHLLWQSASWGAMPWTSG